MILSKKWRWTKALALTLVLVALSCSSNDNETPAPDPGDDGPVTNEAPVFQSPPVGAIEVAEDITDQDVIVALKAEDPEGDEFTFSILEDDDALFEINQDGELSLLAGEQLNAEESDSHSVTVAVKDSNGNQATLQLAITVLEAVALQDDPDAFLTTWSVTDGMNITIGTSDLYDNYDYQIDWGDGSPVENVTGNEPPEHTYATAGDYQVAIKGTFPAIQMLPPADETPEEIENATKLTSIDQWSNNAWRSMKLAFYGCVNMTYTAEDTPELGEVTNMSQMFLSCSSFNGDIGDWDVFTVTDMSGTFVTATSFDQDISGWDVLNVTSMDSMFTGAIKFNQDLSAWGDKLGNVEFMQNMFLNATAFEGLGLEEWDTGNVTNMSRMFKNATLFDRNLGAWDLSSIGPGTDNGIDFDSLEGMLDNSGLSTENYANTLIGWWNEDTPSDINLGAANLKYCSSALTAKSFLQIEFKWDIIDSGSAACN